MSTTSPTPTAPSLLGSFTFTTVTSPCGPRRVASDAAWSMAVIVILRLTVLVAVPPGFSPGGPRGQWRLRHRSRLLRRAARKGARPQGETEGQDLHECLLVVRPPDTRRRARCLAIWCHAVRGAARPTRTPPIEFSE